MTLLMSENCLGFFPANGFFSVLFLAGLIYESQTWLRLCTNEDGTTHNLVLDVNAYRIYEVIYDEEEAKKTPGLSKRWFHAKFLEELVYDFIFPGRSMNAVADTDSMVSNTSTHALSIRSFALFGQGNHEEGVYDLTGSYGRECYLAAVPTVRITKGALGRGYFHHRLDGMRHNWIPALRTTHCQWCYYKLHNEYDEKDRKHFRKALQQNRERIQRCLVCQVTLCPVCDNDHGANLSAYTRVNIL